MLHLKQKGEKDEVEQRYNAAMAVNAPLQKEIAKIQRKLTEKTQDFRDVVSREFVNSIVCNWEM